MIPRLSLILLVALSALSLPAFAQCTITVTSPTSAAVLTGYQGNTLSSSNSGCTTPIAQVRYLMDGVYPVVNPGIGPFANTGVSTTPPFNFPFNTFWYGPGQHTMVAQGFDAFTNPLTGTPLATSAAVSFSIGNTFPVACTGGGYPNWTFAFSIPITSNWSGHPTITPTMTGNCSTDNFSLQLTIDGIQQSQTSFNGPTPGASATLWVDTTQFPDGVHNVCAISQDNTNNTTASGTVLNAGPEICWPITFANGSTAWGLWQNASTVYLAPGGTFQLSPAGYESNGTVVSSPSVVYLAQTSSIGTSVASVSSGGLVTASSTFNGSEKIQTMWEACSGTDLITSSGHLAKSATCPFYPTDIGRLIQVTGGAGSCVAAEGTYLIAGFGGNAVLLEVSTLPAIAASLSNCSFSTGPTSTTWVKVWPTNTLPHFGGNGAILTAYNPAQSFFPHCMFSSSGIFLDQPYYISPAQDISNGGMNCFEVGAVYQDVTGTESSQSTWQAAQSAHVAQYEAYLTSFPKLKWSLTGDNFTRTNTALWGTTSSPDGCASWSTPCFQQTMAYWGNYTNVMWCAMEDEVNSSWNSCPLQGPITFTASAAQSWLGGGGSIVCSSSSCTINGTSQIVLNSTKKFVIHGSSVSGMNSAAGTEYTASGSGSTYTFPCTTCSGTYNPSTDPGLTIEPYADAWYLSNTVYGPLYNSFQTLQTQFNAAGVTFGTNWPNAGGTTAQSIANWGGNGTQSLGAITQVANHTDMYWSPGSQQYLITRLSLNSLVTNNMGNWVRQNYGVGYNPSLPITVLTEGTVVGGGNDGYGQEGYTVAVTFISGSTITFAAGHGISNILPGITRLSITGGSNSALNTDYYVISCPTSTTCTVVLAKSDFVASGSGGTLTFDATCTVDCTKTISTIQATGQNNCNGQGGGGCVDGDPLTYSGSFDSNFSRNRGRSFTVTTSGFTSPTFLYTAQNLTTGGPTVYFREFPTGTSTGGTATIVLDNTYVKGRNWSTYYSDTDPIWGRNSFMESVILGAAGQRMYKWGASANGYVDQASSGFVGAAGSLKGIFADTSLTEPGQLFANQHYENGNAVPLFQEISTLAMTVTRWQKYILQPSSNSPDYGPLVDAAARSGSYGSIIFGFNATNGVENITTNLSACETAGQNVIRNVVGANGAVSLTIITAGTASDSLTAQSGDDFFYVCPINFAAELQQPTMSIYSGDIPVSGSWAVRFAYDPYFLDSAGVVQNCGSSATCTLNADKRFGTLYYRILLLNSARAIVNTGDAQTQ